MPHVLVIDDDPLLLRLVRRMLEQKGFMVDTHSTPASGLGALSSQIFDAVLLDLNLLDSSGDTISGQQILERIVERHPTVPVLMMTGSSAVTDVVAAMNAGAVDYLTKPLDRRKLIDSVQRAAMDSRSRVSKRSTEREAAGESYGIIGESPPIKSLLREIDRVAGSDVTVLIQGESGSGKELVARAIHEGSGRHESPFVAINCAAVAASLQESEFFGHEKGAFTGADSRRIGRFEQANGGTLFLDEVAELSPSLQASLLRVLQERRFCRVGGNKEVVVDVRIVAATHVDLELAVRKGAFRQDLYYRLAVYDLYVPPLRQRRRDISLLAKHFAGESRVWSDEALQCLHQYDWPGNVRELSNAVQRALVSAEGRIERQHLPRRVQGGAPPVEKKALGSLRRIDDLERQAIVDAIAVSGGNISEVIRQLGIPRTSLYRKLKKYGIRTKEI